jgi:SAM-dependent methyltransferase
MPFSNWMIRAKSSIVALGLRTASHRFNGAFSIFMGRPSPTDYGVPEREFVVADGRRIPVYENYRYAVKPGWEYFASLNLLASLERLGRLRTEERVYLKMAMGNRTIGVSPFEALEKAQNAAARNVELFLPRCGAGGLPEFRPDERRLSETIANIKNRHASMFQKLSAAGIYSIPSGASILEIGFISGGHSIFAFEKLGYRAFGIDNGYGGLTPEMSVHGYSKKLISSSVEFLPGDITSRTPFPSNSMDVVFSTSVLEHVQNLEAAFSEMYRLVKPGGVVIHNYSPYFSHDGGHALGIGDSPWAHVRMKKSEYLRYLAELRPYEFETAREWFAHALHDDMPQWKVQRLVAAAGFRIGLWMAKPSPKRWLLDLTPEIMRDCFSSMPEIGIEDLVSRSVSFVGIKA